MKEALAVYDEKGRSQKGHQSPHDLKITVASSGANFIMGWTVNDLKGDLGALWYTAPGGHEKTKGSMIEAIFGDLTEAFHWEPKELKGNLYKCTSKLIHSGAFQVL